MADHEIVVESREFGAIGLKCVSCRVQIAVRPERAAAMLVELNDLAHAHIEAAEAVPSSPRGVCASEGGPYQGCHWTCQGTCSPA